MTAAACMSVQPCVPYDYGGTEKRLFAMPFYTKHDHLPRQARDKHGVALKALKWRRVSAGSFGNEPGAPVTGQPFQSSVYGVELAQAPPAQTRPGAMAAIPYVVQIAKTRCEKRRPFLSHCSSWACVGKPSYRLDISEGWTKTSPFFVLCRAQGAVVRNNVFEDSSGFFARWKVIKRSLKSHFYIKTNILPRQAWDKHRESTQKRDRFLIVVKRCDGEQHFPRKRLSDHWDAGVQIIYIYNNIMQVCICILYIIYWDAGVQRETAAPRCANDTYI